jgi:tRNA(Ile)-lysidine synthase
MLDCSKQELQDWITHKGLHINGRLWCEDATNLDATYPRAFVRHELLPLLEQRNPQIVKSLNRTAEILTAESSWMNQQAADLLPLTIASFSAPPPLLRRAVYLACNLAIEELAPEARITFEHVDLIAREGGKSGFACQIPGGIEVRMVKGSLTYKKAKPPLHDPRCH